MLETTSFWLMASLNIIMITYTIWVLSISRTTPGFRKAVGIGLLLWLGLVHLAISNKAVFPSDISGMLFLISIFAFVGLVGALLFLVPTVRQTLLELDQEQLLLFQGIRVFFGATFLAQASLGVLPLTFGILDGFTHISAGFFGLIAAYAIASGKHGNRRAWFANLFGLADILIVASSLALLLLPQIGPHHSMMYAVFLPAPLWLWFHLVSIWKLVQHKSHSDQFVSG